MADAALAAWLNRIKYRMNALVSKFSTTDADSEIRTAMDIAENDGLTDAMWGSQAGFGQLVKGHTFNIPAVPDVRFGEYLPVNGYLIAYYTFNSSPLHF